MEWFGNEQSSHVSFLSSCWRRQNMILPLASNTTSGCWKNKRSLMSEGSACPHTPLLPSFLPSFLYFIFSRFQPAILFQTMSFGSVWFLTEIPIQIRKFLLKCLWRPIKFSFFLFFSRYLFLFISLSLFELEFAYLA